MNNVKLKTGDKIIGIVVGAVLIFACCIITVSVTSGGSGDLSLATISEVISKGLTSILG